MDDGGGLVDARLHAPRPHQLQSLDIGLVDLLERALAIALVIAAHHDPVIGIGMAQFFFSYQGIAADRIWHDGHVAAGTHYRLAASGARIGIILCRRRDRDQHYAAE